MEQVEITNNLRINHGHITTAMDDTGGFRHEMENNSLYAVEFGAIAMCKVEAVDGEGS